MSRYYVKRHPDQANNYQVWDRYGTGQGASLRPSCLMFKLTEDLAQHAVAMLNDRDAQWNLLDQPVQADKDWRIYQKHGTERLPVGGLCTFHEAVKIATVQHLSWCTMGRDNVHYVVMYTREARAWAFNTEWLS